jgi:UDP-N-acetylmuramoyl-tripeptide--D-alanyl-D-alanine ligase
MKNQPLFTLDEARGCPGLKVSAVGGAVSGVCIDSRQAGPGSLFVALKGEKADGLDFVQGAFASGASAAIVSAAGYAARSSAFAELEGQGMAFLVVEDPLEGFQALAAWYVKRFPALKRIGVTGSSGKTTSKEMIAAIVGKSRRAVTNEGNFNSETGLPLSVFRIRKEHEVGVFELGMNKQGEMDGIVRVLSPDLALITNVGTAHIGILGSQDAIAREKKKIFSLFDGRQTAFIGEDEAYFEFLSSGVRGRIQAFGPKSTPGFGGSLSLGLDGSAIDWEGSRIRLPLPGAHNVRNALGAITVALELGCPKADIKAGLESLQAFFGRGEILRGRVTVFQDCYNANMESLEAAVEFCDSVEWTGGRKVYVLGSLLELGASSSELHAKAGRVAASSKADALFFFGAEMEDAYRAASDSGFPGFMAFSDSADDLSAQLQSYLRDGDFVLMKGSRGMRMERFGQEMLKTKGGLGAC